MSEIIAIIGDTGSGKSTSLRSLNPATTAICNVVGKPLPIKGWKANYTEFKGKEGNYYASDNHANIIKFLKAINDSRPEIKVVIIDDFQYVMSHEYMHRSNEKSFDKFVDIANHAWSIINVARNLREDLKIIFLTHDEQVTSKEDFSVTRKMKTIGKMLDSTITLEGLFTIVLFTKVINTDKGNEYYFETQTDGVTRAKSPQGMFESRLIPNDMEYVVTQIDKYYEG
jgi:hypothetical protein